MTAPWLHEHGIGEADGIYCERPTKILTTFTFVMIRATCMFLSTPTQLLL